MPFFLILFFSLASPTLVNAASANSAQKTLELNFFWSQNCPHCLEAKPFMTELTKKYSWLQLNSYNLVQHPEHVKRYIKLAKELGVAANSVPAFIFCGQIYTGFQSADSTGKMLEQQLIACYQQKTPEQKNEYFTLPLLGKLHYSEFSLPVFTLIIASLDAFNPCAFFVLFFLLSLIVHTRDRLRIALIGGVFVIFSGLMYFLFMAAWLNLFLWTEELDYITAIAGFIAVSIGLINLKDYFFFQQGLSLSIPDSAKSTLFKRMRSITQQGKWPATLAATILLSIVANSYELLCTAGLPMIYTHVLTLNHLSHNVYYAYLALYNVIYILPLLAIVSFFTYHLNGKKISEKEGRLLKLLSGNMMLGLGGILLLTPDLLTNLWISVSVLGSAVLLTVIIHFLFQMGMKIKK